MDPLTIALAIYGGYQGYSSAKKAHANTLGQLFATAAGAYGGYNVGSGITGSEFGQEYLPSALTEKIVPGPSQILSNAASGITGILNPASETNLQAVQNQIPIGGVENIAQNTGTGIQNISTQPQFQQLQPTIMNAGYEQPVQQGLRTLDDSGNSYWTPGPNGTAQITPAGYNTGASSLFNRSSIPTSIQPDITTARGVDSVWDTGVNTMEGPDRLAAAPGLNTAREIDQAYGTGVNTMGGPDRAARVYEKTLADKLLTGAKNTFYDEKEGVKLGNAALVGVPAALYASGAFEKKPYERSLFTYNVNYPDLYRNRTFQVQDPKTGKVYDMPQQSYIPEEKAKQSITNPNQQFGPYKREVLTLNQGGLASLGHFREGGVTYLPTKIQNDETNEDSYMRANGYVEDSTGAGDKNEDTMLAQLADGEFVTRTDGVLGAGILAGANPSDEKQMKKLGADFFYEQQKRFKRIFDLLDASRKATQH